MQNQQYPSTAESAAFMPYSPALRQILQSYGASLLLIYFEGLQQDTFTLDIGRTIARFQVCSRVWWSHLRMIAVGWRSQRALFVARQAGREFVTRSRYGAGAHKPYSYLFLSKQTLRIQRNDPRVQQLFAQAGLPSTAVCLQDSEEMHGFSTRSENFARQISEHARAFSAQVVDPMNDGRRRPDIKRKPHHRRPWTEDRRAKFNRTIEERRGDKRVSSDVAME